MDKRFAPALSASGPSPLWDSGRDHLRVILRDLVVEAKVGLHPWEQHAERPSRLVVNVEIFAPAGPPGNPAPGGILNYDVIRDALKAWPGRPHTPLLETLAEELVALCLSLPGAAAARVSVLKPDIFNEAAAAGIELYRVRT